MSKFRIYRDASEPGYPWCLAGPLGERAWCSTWNATIDLLNAELRNAREGKGPYAIF